jgi:acyl-CoA dehydrogenase
MSDYIDLPLGGLTGRLSDMESTIQEITHRFALEVLRPAGIAMDKMTAEEAVGPDSPLWSALSQASELGLSVSATIEMEPLERTRLFLIAAQEFGWGEGGLAGMILVSMMPSLYSALAGNMEMVEYCEGKLGCWGITEPDHGSDMLDASGQIAAENGNYGRPNCIAEIQGDKIVINGQKSAWVSGGITAEVCALYCHAKVGDEVKPGYTIIVPLDLPGVSKGKPLDKIGLRALNQGEIYFENVEVPLNHIIATPENYTDFVYDTLAEANLHVGNLAVGVARSAYEHALQYAHERKQGGQPIIRHQSVRHRLFHMFRKLEAASALVFRAAEFNATAPRPAIIGSMSAKVNGTQTAFEIASEALQIFGGNGLTREYPMEKLLRDARAMLIADGCNEVLAMKGGSELINPELL